MTQIDSSKLLAGGLGLSSSKGFEFIASIDPAAVNEGVGIVTQIVILLATLISLFRSKKPRNN